MNQQENESISLSNLKFYMGIISKHEADQKAWRVNEF